MKTDNKTIEIDETPVDDSRPTEVPTITIEHGPAERPRHGHSYLKRLRSRRVVATLCAIVAATFAAGAIYLIGKRHATDPGVPAGISESQNIAQLAEPYTPSAAGTSVVTDSILGVAMDFYSLDGLVASLEPQMPDTADRSLVLFMRSADYHPDTTAIGSIVIGGKAVASKGQRNRGGYVAIAPTGKTVIGISQSTNRIADNAVATGGSMFSQFVLLGDAMLPATFSLHGKVERAALARLADGSTYYVTTRHKETMYDFADALREYGVVDAVYITGGNNYTFHRTPDGAAHITDATRAKIAKYTAAPLPTPLLVFRTPRPTN